MKQWDAEITVNCSIDKVWYIIDGNEEHLKILDPHIIKNEVIKETPEKIGSTYLQEYKEGKRIMEYIVTVLDYKETGIYKCFKIGFTLDGMFDITAAYDLTRVDDNQTHVKYTVTNKPLKFFTKIMLFLMRNDKVIDEHLQKVKNLSEDSSLN